MTAFAACLFVVAALVSAHVIWSNWLRHADTVHGLRTALRQCPETVMLEWKMVERVPLPTLAILRKDRMTRIRRTQWTPGLEWPSTERAEGEWTTGELAA